MCGRLYKELKHKGVSTNSLCKTLNIKYPNFIAMLEGKQPCYGKWQKKICETLGVERQYLFKEFLNGTDNTGNDE